MAKAHKYAWVARLPARTLRELAALAPPDRPEFSNPAQAAVELAAMLDAGTRPTIGWYRRHYAGREPADRSGGADDQLPPPDRDRIGRLVGEADSYPRSPNVVSTESAEGEVRTETRQDQIRRLVAAGAVRASHTSRRAQPALAGSTLVQPEQVVATRALLQGAVDLSPDR